MQTDTFPLPIAGEACPHGAFAQLLKTARRPAHNAAVAGPSMARFDGHFSIFTLLRTRRLTGSTRFPPNNAILGPPMTPQWRQWVSAPSMVQSSRTRCDSQQFAHHASMNILKKDRMSGIAAFALAGVPIGALLVLPNAVLADCTDFDARHTGSRREAMLFGVQGLLLKVRALGLSLISVNPVES